MGKIHFAVSARTARLIGQENFTNAEGAIIELVKNAYDADATICLVIYDLPFHEFKNPLSENARLILQNIAPELYQQLDFDEGTFHLTEESLKRHFKKIWQILTAQNAIFIVDNGQGMNDDIIQKHWMTIGTGNKELEYVSGDGRIKTGAKGIGRFALDRLGAVSEMWTLPTDMTDGFYWKMDWEQFEAPNSVLSDIEADLEPDKVNIEGVLRSRFQGLSFFDAISTISFRHGTIIKISKLRDDWNAAHIESNFQSLGALIPPKELSIPFKVFQGHLQQEDKYGQVETAFFNDYDYKIFAQYSAQTTMVTLQITRNELDLNLVEHKFPFIYENAEWPYDLDTLRQKEFTQVISVNELMRWPKDARNNELLKAVGDFSFNFYFMKNSVSNKESYPFMTFNARERQKVLERFGGIKIYRDSFRVRPYGDSGNDWLKLGEQAQRSPAGAGQRIGDWRVGPNQVAGIISISRVENPNIIDKSDRGSLVENETFHLFSKIVTSTIHQFEYDRSRILNPYYLYFDAEKKKKKQLELQETARKIAEKMYQDKLKLDGQTADGGQQDTGGSTGSSGEQADEQQRFQELLEEQLSKLEEGDEKDAELAQVRSLASLGLIVSSFAHELREIRNNVDEISDLEAIYKEIIPAEAKAGQLYLDGINIFALLKSGGEKTKHWVDYSLTAIKKDKRKRSSFNFAEYFRSLQKNWEIPLKDRSIQLELVEEETIEYEFRAFEIDMDTIFGNLITNSIDSFNSMDIIIDRKITISHIVTEGRIYITYRDNGGGLPNVFVNVDDVFLPFTTSKKDRYGNDIGTGLGMYLAKMVVQDNKGHIAIQNVQEGFCIMMDFPTRNT